MALAHRKQIKNKHHLGLKGFVLTFLWIFALDTSSATSAKDHCLTDSLPAIAGYVSQEKRFLMYLFNGNVGKVQVV